MCRLYHIDKSPRELARQFGLRLDLPLPNFAPSWRVATTDPAPVIRRHPQTGERRLDVLHWGLVPHWVKEPTRALRPVNARSDTVATAAMFRGAYRERRCLVPVTGWYEWRKRPDGGKQAYAFARQHEEPMAFAGLWESVRWPDGEVLRTFAVLTTGPNAEAAAIHERMPLALNEADWPLWLGESDADPATLLHPPPDGTFRIWPILSPLGKGRPNGPELLNPIPPAL
jgi:putative SOS response-associated peptidase YedK